MMQQGGTIARRAVGVVAMLAGLFADVAERLYALTPQPSSVRIDKARQTRTAE